MPMDNPDLRTITAQRPNYDVPADEYLSQAIEYTLTKVIMSNIELYLGLEEHKRELGLRHDYSLQDLFIDIDQH